MPAKLAPRFAPCLLLILLTACGSGPESKCLELEPIVLDPGYSVRLTRFELEQILSTNMILEGR